MKVVFSTLELLSGHVKYCCITDYRKLNSENNMSSSFCFFRPRLLSDLIKMAIDGNALTYPSVATAVTFIYSQLARKVSMRELSRKGTSG